MSAIQDVFMLFYSRYGENHTPSPQQNKSAVDIMNCKTADLGGHVFECDSCGHKSVHYNSCRNRHCPSCQGVNNAIWVDERSRDILNAPYFHVVFTLPQQLQLLLYQNQKLLYALMYKCVAQTILELCKDKKYLGAQPGFFSVLHTWGQDLHFHPHIHSVVLAGGLTKLNKWQSCSEEFFIPVKVLAKKFRGKFLYHLKNYYRRNLLVFFGATEEYESPKLFRDLIHLCYTKDWYCYTKKTFSGPLAVVKYLGRYTHRIAISNQRIVAINENTITIAIKDYKNGSSRRTLILTGIEFIRRFLMHILPKGFVKIRHYGLLANRNKKTKLALCRQLTHSPTYKPKFEGLTTIEIISQLAGRDVTICSKCKQGKLMLLSSFYPGASP